MAGDSLSGKSFTVPLEFATLSAAIVAIKGAGKSNAGVVLAEEMWKAGVPWVAIDAKGDWHGIRSSAQKNKPGLPVPVFGGLHGDLPLEPTSGAFMAELIVDRNLTCVLDVSDFDSKQEMLRFVHEFGQRLFRLHAKTRTVRHLFLEECDEYMPQKPSEKGYATPCLSTYQRIVKQGRHRGLGSTMISQRPAVINKDALTQCDVWFVLRMTAKQDRDAIRGAVEYHVDAKAIVDSLPMLQAGEAWVVSPAALQLMIRIGFRRRWTLDTGSTPTMAGESPIPATIADIDLGAIEQAMAETIERAKAEDPKELQRQVRQLEAQIRQLSAEKDAEPIIVDREVEVEVIVEVVPDEVWALADALRDVASVLGTIETEGRDGFKSVYDVIDTLERVKKDTPPKRRYDAGAKEGPVKSGSRPVAHPGPAPTTPRPTVIREPANPDDVRLKAGARRMLEVLARQHPLEVTKRQLGTLAKVSFSGGSFGQYLSSLRVAGLIVELKRGGKGGGLDLVELTDAGWAYLGMSPLDSSVMTTVEIVAMYGDRLKAGAKRMLDLLIDAHPRGLTKPDLSERSQVSITGGSFGQYLSSLRTNGLIEERDGLVYAGAVLQL